MSEVEGQEDDVDARLARLELAKNEAINACHYRTATRIAEEIRRLSRTERKLGKHVWALHTITNSATSLLDPERGRESAIELIAILESEDRARAIQPDVPSHEYDYYVGQVSSCAYDNLAKSTAMVYGYNSDGIHSAIAEGIQVCRRTGKLECITCFREYATDVYLAADDLQMSLHHASHVTATGNVKPGFDRRYCGSIEEARIQVLSGQLETAEQTLRRTFELAESFFNPILARIKTYDVFETVRLLRGHPEPRAGDPAAPAALPEGEWPMVEWLRDQRAVIRASLIGDHAEAIRILTTWDRRLTERHCMSQWTEARLRLIAAHRLAGNLARVQALAKPLEKWSKDSRDWLDLRRLGRLLNPSEPIDPTAAAAPMSSGPWAPESAHAAVDLRTESIASEAAVSDLAVSKTPLQDLINGLTQALTDSEGNPEKLAVVRDTLFAQTIETVCDPTDAARLIYLAPFSFTEMSLAKPMWEWAEGLAAKFPESSVVLIRLGVLGDWLIGLEGSAVAETVTRERINAMIRRGLDLDPDHAMNFARAGGYYSKNGDATEAERCYARSFRLARGNADTALRLAELYRQGDRARDALAVLDMNLREGSNVAEVAWQAAILAHSLNQDEAMLTYLDHLERIEPGRPWANHYRGVGLLRLGRATEALEALEDELRRQNAESRLNVSILKACALAALRHLEEFRQALAEVLATRLTTVDYLSLNGLARLYAQLWTATSQALPETDPLRRALDSSILETGLAPNELFDQERKKRPTPEAVNFYECQITQPLDDRWSEHGGCLAGQEGWTRYQMAWGVLAKTEEEARQCALEWQARCYFLEASVDRVQAGGEGYADYPGIVWQGGRTGYAKSSENIE